MVSPGQVRLTWSDQPGSPGTFLHLQQPRALVRCVRSVSVSRGRGRVDCVNVIVGFETAGGIRLEERPSVTILTHCMDMSEVRSSEEMVSMSKSGRAMMQRRRMGCEWKRS